MHKRGVPIWQGYAHAGADYGPLTGAEVDIRGGEQVTAGVARVSALRQRESRVEPGDQDVDGSGFGASAGHTTILRAVMPGGRVALARRRGLTRAGYSPGGPSRNAGHAYVMTAAVGTAMIAPGMPAITPPTASTRMIASGWSLTIRPTTSGWSRCPSIWFSTMSTASRMTAATHPLVTSAIRIARPPTSRMNAAIKTSTISGSTSGTPRIHSASPRSSEWMTATTVVPRM